MSPVCYVGIGSNLGDPVERVRAALRSLAGLGAVRASSLYRTEPLGDPGQPWYCNAVAELATELEPVALLERLQALERAAGRRRTPAGRWAPRELDLDLLLWGERVIDSPGLRIPHPELHRRRFVLAPLAELAPGLRHPELGRSVGELLAGVDDRLRVEKLPPPGVRDARECRRPAADPSRRRSAS